MKTEIPEELVAAQRELEEATTEHVRLSTLAEAAWDRRMAAIGRQERAWEDFRHQVGKQVHELAAPAEEGR